MDPGHDDCIMKICVWLLDSKKFTYLTEVLVVCLLCLCTLPHSNFFAKSLLFALYCHGNSKFFFFLGGGRGELELYSNGYSKFCSGPGGGGGAIAP